MGCHNRNIAVIYLKIQFSSKVNVLLITGVQSAASCFVVPMATGMSLVLCMLTLRLRRPGAKYVIWPRIDQKSCIKAMITAGTQIFVLTFLPENDIFFSRVVVGKTFIHN